MACSQVRHRGVYGAAFQSRDWSRNTRIKDGTPTNQQDHKHSLQVPNRSDSLGGPRQLREQLLAKWRSLLRRLLPSDTTSRLAVG